MQSLKEVLPHHIKQPYCEDRESYRKGKRLTAVKVYTINDESAYLIISRVQQIKLEKELIKIASPFGNIKLFKKLNDYPTEEFEEAYLIQYTSIEAAKKAKKFLDEKSFFGSMLHVFYAPEFESPEEVAYKIKHRCQSVVNRLKYLKRTEKELQKGKTKKESHKVDPIEPECLEQKPSNSQIGPKWQSGHQMDFIVSSKGSNLPETPQVSYSTQQGRNLKRLREETSHKHIKRPKLHKKTQENLSAAVSNRHTKLSSGFAFVPRSVKMKVKTSK